VVGAGKLSGARCAVFGRLAVMITGIVGAGNGASIAIAEPVDVRVEIHLPTGADAGELVWAVMRDGQELGVRRSDADAVRDALNAVEPLKFTHAVELADDASPVEIRACVNGDRLIGYAPSFGDWYQRATAKQADDGWNAVIAADGWRRHRPERDDSGLTIHYHRYDGLYDHASLWTWDEHLRRAPTDNDLPPVGRDESGLVFQLDTAQYGEPGGAIGLLPRRFGDWAHKDGGDRMWQPPLGDEVWIVQGGGEVFADKPDLSPKITRATLDGAKQITIRVTHATPVADWTIDRVTVAAQPGPPIPIESIKPVNPAVDTSMAYRVTTASKLRFPGARYRVEVEGLGEHSVTPGRILADRSLFYSNARMGAIHSKDETTFRVFAPIAESAAVVVADALDADRPDVYLMKRESGGIWSVQIESDLTGQFYAYRLTGPGYDNDREVTDPYATCTQARHARSLIVDLDATDPAGFDDYQPSGPESPTDAIIYEMHVRDFTIAANSGVEHHGKYLGLTESGTTLPDDPAIKTGIDHLVELGVTHVQLMPVQDYDNNETKGDSYNWGYMPVHFNSPEGWYASSAAGDAKIRELKAAIKALHDRGIGVILDVVYNHTAGWAPFDATAPGYYYRTDEWGARANGSGCGNEFASEHPMARKFIIDSVRYWVDEYKVDGFRFDLMGLIDLETMKQVKTELAKAHPHILVYGEPWTGGATPLSPITDKQHVAGSGVGAFNDHFRDAIKGDRDGGAAGFIQTGARADGVAAGLIGAIDDWSSGPADTINYFAAHDNLTAWDKLLQSAPDADDAARKRMLRLATLILMTSQGAVFLHSGQEFCRSKQGNYNSYNQPDAINRIDWALKKKNADVVAYTRSLIAFRKAHPALRLASAEAVRKRVRCDVLRGGKAVRYQIDGRNLDRESAKTMLVLLNGAGEPLDIDLPAGEWSVHADADQASMTPMRTVTDRVTVSPHSGMLLVQPN